MTPCVHGPNEIVQPVADAEAKGCASNAGEIEEACHMWSVRYKLR